MSRHTSKVEQKLTVKPSDCQLHWFSGKGKGGQHRNKHKNCVRLHHQPSGAWIVAQDHKSREQNLTDAMQRLSKHHLFRYWAFRELAPKMDVRNAEEVVEDLLNKENLQWKPEGDSEWRPFEEDALDEG